MGQVEKPNWCRLLDAEIMKNPQLVEEKYPGWDVNTCNDKNESFTSWNYTKYSDTILMPLECFMFCFLLFTNWIHNQYREADFHARMAFRFQIILTVLVIAQSVILLMIPGE